MHYIKEIIVKYIGDIWLESMKNALYIKILSLFISHLRFLLENSIQRNL